jgi:two-component system sensor histidine kinase HydH
MVQEVDRLNRVITELLDFARPSDLKKELSDIGELISRSIKLIRQDANNKNIKIEVDTADDLCPVWIDPDRLAQCLLNLYINAVQAMDTGGTLTVRCSESNAEHVKIVVSDTGRGIAPGDLNKIFDPYFTTKKKGTGLGLAIVYKIIEGHKGHIDVVSTLDKGTTFTLSIPCNLKENA